MGNCFFFKYASHSKGQPVSDPSTIKMVQEMSEHSIINPQNLHIDLIIENELPSNLLQGNRKEGTEVSVDSPVKSPTVVLISLTKKLHSNF